MRLIAVVAFVVGCAAPVAQPAPNDAYVIYDSKGGCPPPPPESSQCSPDVHLPVGARHRDVQLHRRQVAVHVVPGPRMPAMNARNAVCASHTAPICICCRTTVPAG